MAVAWNDQLRAKLKHEFGTSKGEALFKKYSDVFPHVYKDSFSANTVVKDIELIEKLSIENPLEIQIYQQEEFGDEKYFNVKLLQYERPIPLSDILPILENMDLRTYSEHPYKLTLPDGKYVYISDFNVEYEKAGPDFEVEDVAENFEDALDCIVGGICESDGFNKLILGVNLNWRSAVILRVYAKYLHQIGFRYTQVYLAKTLASYPEITQNLLKLFELRFDPQHKSPANKIKTLNDVIKKILETITNLEEDKILRSYWQLINATLRTNFYQLDADKQCKTYISIKLDSNSIPDLPLPKPLYEVFVYSPDFEAIHLRAAKVARGGIRWSDRREDFRTEILGLMKAQKVKNAIIVPSGAKGGFVLKHAENFKTRETLQAEVIRCYKSFMCGLLDITDNLKNGKVIHPPQVIRYDGDDTYLVVAADKGTSTFSDIANALSKEYDFWLGDAFASGGSAGYDHKKMGITARGAWESVKRHFRNLSINVREKDFTVVGIGDMSGDVFGNGMLYTDHIKLIAAFDHRHIFLDPNPDTKASFLERKRLFALPTSSWNDYDPKLISKGGGVFSRSIKSIVLSAEIKKALKIDANTLNPNDLIKAILRAPVDLLYNGGIGTYVKATMESQVEVGDKANEFNRVNGSELRCKVVGEGGNLGFTQLGRIEYALNGGLINTDFIDNSGGVDCSDHEVNLKILLNKEVTKGNLTESKRNQLLESMTDEVGDLVLADNYYQALAMGFSSNHSATLSGLYQAYLNELEKTKVLDRVVEFLPDEKTIAERRAEGKGLVSPELAELLAYTKIHIKAEILASEVPDDPYLGRFLNKAFPAKITKLYNKELQTHPLRREIIATQLSNRIVNEMGITFFYRLQTETGTSVGNIIRAHVVASHIFDSHELEQVIDSLEVKIPVKLQYELLHYVRNLINLATRWFLKGNRLEGDLEKIIEHYKKPVKQLEKVVPNLMSGITKTYLDSLKERFSSSGIAADISERVAITRAIYTSLNVIEVATENKFDLMQAAKLYFEVGSRFNLVWFRDQIAADNREGHWNTLARLTLRDELDILQKLLTIIILKNMKRNQESKIGIETWVQGNSTAIDRWEKILEKLYNAGNVDYAMFFIAIRELSNWVAIKA